MFTNTSMAGTGAAIVVVLNAILPLLGLEFPDGTIQAFIESVINIIGFIFLVVGQLRRKDLKFGFIRK